LVEVGIFGRVARLGLAGPHPLHLLEAAMLAAIPAAVARAVADPAVDLLVLRGSGKDGGVGPFSAGADLAGIAAMPVADAEAHAALGQAATRAVAEAPVPVLAVIDGPCLGGGLELALACDLRVATARAVFGYPAAQRGLIPAFGGTRRAPAVLGPSRAAELAYTARRITAEEALAWGLLAAVDGRNDADALEAAWVDRLTEGILPGAARRLKAAFMGAGDLTEQAVFRACLEDPRAREAMAAFLAGAR
jgi:enoyl-CoA hydratase